MESSSNWIYNGTSTTTPLLEVVHFNYPWILIVVFLTAFLINSIRSSESSRSTTAQILTGPGGKPLPAKVKKSKSEAERLARLGFSPIRKTIFKYLSVGVVFTFGASFLDVALHAVTERENGWWCGQATVVGHFS